MARAHTLSRVATRKLSELVKIEAEYQRIQFRKRAALTYGVEYLFLESFKTWECFVEDVFVSHTKYNDPVAGKRPYPFLAPKNEKHALELLTLERSYIDWTSPDNIVSRAETCFRGHSVMTDPIKRHMQDLRDMKKIRNHIAHSSKESLRVFKDLSRNRIGSVVTRPGEYLNHISPDSVNNYNIYYMNMFMGLVASMSN